MALNLLKLLDIKCFARLNIKIVVWSYCIKVLTLQKKMLHASELIIFIT